MENAPKSPKSPWYVEPGSEVESLEYEPKTLSEAVILINTKLRNEKRSHKLQKEGEEFVLDMGEIAEAERQEIRQIVGGIIAPANDVLESKHDNFRITFTSNNGISILKTESAFTPE